MTLKSAIDLLTASGYLLIEKYEKPQLYNIDESCPKMVGLYLDVETTGLDVSSDRIIEIGLVTFEFSGDGRIFKLLEEYSHYQDPEVPIPTHITEITGITNDMVKDMNIDKDILVKYLTEADLIIAHNAAFDRGFIESFIPSAPTKPWACSMIDVTWSKEGIESSKLEYLAYKYGFYYDGHQAVTDCLAGIHVLSKKLPKSKKYVLSEVLENTKKSKFKLWAEGAPFESKDILKRRGYKWNSEQTKDKYKAWWIELDEDETVEELSFLWASIYNRKIKLPIDVINMQTRFSVIVNSITEEQKILNKNIVKNIYIKAGLS